MTYRLKITRMEKNEQYAEEVKAHEERQRRYGGPPMNYGDGPYPQSEREMAQLETVITPAEWEIIKRALVQHWATTEAP